jgi:hypothetical protein
VTTAVATAVPTVRRAAQRMPLVVFMVVPRLVCLALVSGSEWLIIGRPVPALQRRCQENVLNGLHDVCLVGSFSYFLFAAQPAVR